MNEAITQQPHRHFDDHLDLWLALFCLMYSCSRLAWWLLPAWLEAASSLARKLLCFQSRLILSIYRDLYALFCTLEEDPVGSKRRV